MPDPYEQLCEAVDAWVPLAEPQAATLRAAFRRRALRAREHLTLPGDGGHEVLFIAEGLLRFYYGADDGGAESNKAFVGAGDFAGPLAAAALGLPLDYGVQALEPTVVLAAPYAAFVRLMEEDRTFERLGRKLTERLLAHKEARARRLLQQDAAARYRAFVSAHPDLVQRVPQYHIASYLGITDVHLSRIRRAMAEAASTPGAREQVTSEQVSSEHR